ncbi:MAG: FAD-binding protein [Candidatus Limivivens sp.]|nr:FAD-binding protein [Candidatus Limivivens sp.]
MAKDLFAGGRVHGDTAWAEAAGSAKSFLKLACMNVPFPMNEYGEYVGYQTDHDTSCRATSAGPLTSRYMTEALERAVLEKKVLILDKTMAFQLLVHQGQTEGVLCMSREGIQGSGRGLLVLAARHVILATGGAAGCYYHSVFPKSQTGMSGMALEAGASGTNLDQWQYGLASVKFRWNVSGTYQQVLPRYFSVDEQGKEREFLKEAFENPEEMLYRIFQKGYQWPFDPAKKEGSSRIDLLVYRETAVFGQKVYLDYRRNPGGLAEDFGNLHEEAYRYLENSQALLETPIARLEKMNPLAIELYKSHGIDLYREPLEINVCAQHQNGGISVDKNWQTEIKGLYAAGEAAGTFGVRRPGGSALNSAQVGSMWAAEHIAWETEENLIPEAGFGQRAKKACEKWMDCFEKLLGEPEQAVHPLRQRAYFSEKMSACAAHVREPEQIR